MSAVQRVVEKGGKVFNWNRVIRTAEKSFPRRAASRFGNADSTSQCSVWLGSIARSGERTEGIPRIRTGRWPFGAVEQGTGRFTRECFHHPIFERMKSDHRQPTARPQSLRGRRQHRTSNAPRVRRLPRFATPEKPAWPDASGPVFRDDAFDHPRQGKGVRKRDCAPAHANDGGRHARRGGFLAVFPGKSESGRPGWRR